MMEVVMVWYFLAVYPVSGATIRTLGPFQTEGSCNELKAWAHKTDGYKSFSDCYQAPLIAVKGK